MLSQVLQALRVRARKRSRTPPQASRELSELAITSCRLFAKRVQACKPDVVPNLCPLWNLTRASSGRRRLGSTLSLLHLILRVQGALALKAEGLGVVHAHLEPQQSLPIPFHLPCCRLFQIDVRTLHHFEISALGLSVLGQSVLVRMPALLGLGNQMVAGLLGARQQTTIAVPAERFKLRQSACIPCVSLPVFQL